MSSNVELTSRTTNVPKAVEEIIKGYQKRPAKGLIHGFQKDSIQNSWGARIAKKGKEWKFQIRYIKNEKGEFLIVEDFGCLGLTGKNYTQEEISRISDLDESERLARFSAMNYSGGVTTGAGNFGRGKRMYQAVSNDYMYYFDSSTQDGKYYANIVTGQDKTMPKSLEDDEAKAFIFEKTGLGEKEGTGTRVIISNPKSEVIEGIKSLDILENINETWWPIILKYDALIEMYINDELIGKGEVPSIYKKYLNDKSYFYKYEVTNYIVKDYYKIKKMEFYLIKESDNISSDLRNISYYRQDMKIGDVVDIYELPIEDKYKDRIFGYIEFEHDGEWENELKENEDLEHYGILQRKYNNYQLMKKVVFDHLNKFCTDKGLKKENRDIEQNKKLKDLANDLTKFLYNDSNDFEWSNVKGPHIEKSIILTCEKKYPHAPNRIINYGEEIKYCFKIKNNNLTFKNFKYSVNAINQDTAEIINIDSGKIYVNGEIYISDEKVIKYDSLIKECRNLISIKVESIDDSSLYDNTSFPVYVDIEDEKEVGDFDIDIEYDKDINNTEFHHGEELNINKIVIFNNTGYTGNIGLNVTIQDTTQRNQEIEKICQKNDIYIEKYSFCEVEIPEIVFSDKYDGRKGKLRIRYAIVNISGIDIVGQYDKLLEKFDSIYFEEPKQDKNIGMPFDVATLPFDDDKIYIRSKLETESINKYKLIFNSRYILWNDVNRNENSSSQKVLYDLYSIEEMIRAMIQIQLSQLNYKIIDLKENTDCSADIIQRKIDLKVSEYLGKYFEGRK